MAALHVSTVGLLGHRLQVAVGSLGSTNRTWFGIITRQFIRRGAFSNVKVLIKQTRDYITH